MPEQKKTRRVIAVSVQADGKAEIRCPKCGARSRFDVSKFRNHTRPVPVTCKCGNSFLCAFKFNAADAQESRQPQLAKVHVDDDLPVVDIDSDTHAPKKTASDNHTQVAEPVAPAASGPPIAKKTDPPPAPEKKPTADKSVHTCYVDKTGKAKIICPQCNKAKTVAISHVNALGRTFPVKCGCGHTFSCKFVPKERLASSGQSNVYFAMIKGELPGLKPLVFHVDSQGEAMIHCPVCSNFKRVKPTTDETLNGLCIFNCQCGSTFPFKIDFRRSYRKPVNLPGSYYNLRLKENGEMWVRNVSIGGLGIYVEGEALDGIHDFKKGDMLDVSFHLDDARRSEINRRVEIRTIHGPSIGCRFADSVAHDKELGFYLMA